MEITIHLSTENPSDNEALYRLFNSGKPTHAAPEPVVATSANPTTVAAPQAPAPAPKAAAKPKPQPKPEPVVEEPVEDLLGGEVDFAALRTQAVSRATELVTAVPSQKDRVKEALTTLGVNRVSELADGQLESFIGSLA